MRLLPISTPIMQSEFEEAQQATKFIDIDRPWIPPFTPNDVEIF